MQAKWSVIWLLAVVMAWPASAASIKWQTNTKSAVRSAQRNNQLLMFYAFGSRRDRDDEMERRQTRALAEDKVVRAADDFVCVRINIAQEQELLKRLGIRADLSSSLTLFWTTSDLQLLDRLSAAGVAQAQSILDKMKSVKNRFRDIVLNDILPVLADPEASDEDLQHALDQIARFNLTQASPQLGKLLQCENLHRRLRDDGYKLLGKFGTEEGVQILFEHSQSEDDEIADAAKDGLEECDPPAARFLFEYLRSSDAQTQFAAYEAVGTIAKVYGLRKIEYFKQVGNKQREREVDRVKDEAVKKIERWERKNERRR